MKPIHRIYLRQKIPVILSLLFTAAFASCGNHTEKSAPVAHNGVLDLSGWDFTRDGPVALAGDWKFKWEEAAPEFEQAGYDDSSWGVFNVPNFWNILEKGAEGYAWFRLKVRHASLPADELGIYLQTMQTAGRLFIDGREVMHDGIPGTSRETTIACNFPQTEPFAVESGGEFVIAWNIANYHNRNGGPRFSPIMGLLKDLSFSMWLQDLRDVFVAGFIVMMGLYSVIIWFLRKKEKASLYFAILCFFIALRIILLGSFFQRFFPDLNIFDIRMRSESIVTLLAALVFINFMHYLFPREIHYKFLRLCNWITLAAGAFLLILPSWITTHLTLYCDFLFVIYFLWILIAIVQAIRKKRNGAKIVLAGMLIFGLTLMNDILYTSLPNFYTLNLFWLGMVVVIVCYSGILSYRFAQAHKTSEELSQNLQKEVDRQTAKITAQNRELEKLIKEKTDSFINFNHEIKTPLTLMGNYLENAMGTHGQAQDLQIVKQNLDKLKRDVTNSLDLEKLIRNQAFYRHDQTVPLSAVVQEKVALFGVMAKNKGIELSFTGESDLYIAIDPFALDRIINNLLDNAIRYTERGGQVTVSLKKSAKNGKKIECTVADTGIGISSEQLGNIFEPYYQVRCEKSNLQGMGMGLNIVKRIMDELHGEIRVESREQKGSRFILSFDPASPCSEKEGAPAIPVLSQPLAPVETRLKAETYEDGKDTLFIVEDNKSMLAYLQGCLSDDYNIFYARSGREAVLKLESIPAPDLILSDIMMDEMDGYEFLDILIRSEKYHSIPLVFLTARTTPEDKLMGLAKGAVDVIHKPFRMEELLAKIRSLIQNRRTAREHVIREIREGMGAFLKNGNREKELFLLREENYRRFRITRREQEIIVLLVQGLEYKEISDRLSISLNTIKPYIGEIYKKCGVKNKVELIGIFKTN